MSAVAAGLLTSYGMWKTFQWLLPERQSAINLEGLSPEDWIKKSDINVMLFTLEFYTGKHRKKPTVQKLEDQRKKVEELVDKLQSVLRWKNDGLRYYYRSWYYTGEKSLFRKLKEEHAILIKRMELLKQIDK